MEPPAPAQQNIAETGHISQPEENKKSVKIIRWLMHGLLYLIVFFLGYIVSRLQFLLANI